MKVSIIVPTFNSAKTVEDTIKSIINQNYIDFQIIIQDGGSTDNTKDIVAKYPMAMLGWRSEPDNGIYDAMNKGISRATGEIVAILNSDDTWLPNVLERVVSVFVRNPDVGIVSGSIEAWENSSKGNKIILKSSILHLYKGMTIQHPATFVRRSVYECVGLFNTCYNIGADYDFLLRCIKVNIPCIILEDILTRMRVGGNSSSTLTLDGWRVRSAHKLSSAVKEPLSYTNNFIRHFARRIILNNFGEKAVSVFRGYLWRKRTYQ